MNKDAIIEHKGTISEIKNNSIFVELNVQSACSSCHAKGMCGFDRATKTIEIITTDISYEIGEIVKVKLNESLGMKALFLGYILPFLILATTLILFLAVTKLSEGLSAILAISLLIPYYLILFLNKDKIKKEFDFKIEKI